MDLRRTKPWMVSAWVILAVCLGSTAFAGSRRPIPFVEGSWTLVVLPDTQFYTKTYAEIFRSQTRWIANQKDIQNVAFVLHEGDLTDTNSPGEWEQASLAMGTLDTAGIPYAIVPGNHDYEGNAASRNTRINTFFPVSRFSESPTFGGVYELKHIENSYHLFHARGHGYVVLALEFGPRDQVLTWANQVLSQYADRTAIIVTHAYTYSDGSRLDHIYRPWQINNPHSYSVANLPGGVNDGQEIWDDLLARHENTSFVFSGHISPGNARQVCWGLKGNTVHEILADYQIRPLGGEGYLRLIEFLPDGETIQVLTYSPYLDRYLTDRDNLFILQFHVPLPPDIKANGLDGPIVVSSETSVSVAVTLDPGNWAGREADWWVAAYTSFAWYTYIYPSGWQSGIHRCVQTPLFEIATPIEVLNRPLPKGKYIFYFAVDGNTDDLADGTWMDSVEVTVAD
jgi:hypothetical protein